MHSLSISDAAIRLRPRVDPERTLISIAAAADRLNVCDKTIRRHISAGRLTAFRVGARLIRIDRAEVDGLLRVIPAAGGRDA